jgi:hypothetical protein
MRKYMGNHSSNVALSKSNESSSNPSGFVICDCAFIDSEASCDNTLHMRSKSQREAPRGEDITFLCRAEYRSGTRNYLD